MNTSDEAVTDDCCAAYTTDKLEALVRETEGKDLIKDCLVRF